jgi:hypothetical protein
MTLERPPLGPAILLVPALAILAIPSPTLAASHRRLTCLDTETVRGCLDSRIAALFRAIGSCQPNSQNIRHCVDREFGTFRSSARSCLKRGCPRGSQCVDSRCRKGHSVAAMSRLTSAAREAPRVADNGPTLPTGGFDVAQCRAAAVTAAGYSMSVACENEECNADTGCAPIMACILAREGILNRALAACDAGNCFVLDQNASTELCGSSPVGTCCLTLGGISTTCCGSDSTGYRCCTGREVCARDKTACVRPCVNDPALCDHKPDDFCILGTCAPDAPLNSTDENGCAFAPKQCDGGATCNPLTGSCDYPCEAIPAICVVSAANCSVGSCTAGVGTPNPPDANGCTYSPMLCPGGTSCDPTTGNCEPTTTTTTGTTTP